MLWVVEVIAPGGKPGWTVTEDEQQAEAWYAAAIHRGYQAFWWRL